MSTIPSISFFVPTSPLPPTLEAIPRAPIVNTLLTFVPLIFSKQTTTLSSVVTIGVGHMLTSIFVERIKSLIQNHLYKSPNSLKGSPLHALSFQPLTFHLESYLDSYPLTLLKPFGYISPIFNRFLSSITMPNWYESNLPFTKNRYSIIRGLSVFSFRIIFAQLIYSIVTRILYDLSRLFPPLTDEQAIPPTLANRPELIARYRTPLNPTDQCSAILGPYDTLHTERELPNKDRIAIIKRSSGKWELVQSVQREPNESLIKYLYHCYFRSFDQSLVQWNFEPTLSELKMVFATPIPIPKATEIQKMESLGEFTGPSDGANLLSLKLRIDGSVKCFHFTNYTKQIQRSS